MSAISTISSKGQITLPQEVRQRLGVGEGDKVEFSFDGQQTVVRPVRAQADPFTKWVGVAKRDDGPEAKVIDELRETRGYDDWDRKDLGL